jgi:hypothetical protein
MCEIGGFKASKAESSQGQNVDGQVSACDELRVGGEPNADRRGLTTLYIVYNCLINNHLML